MWQSFANRNCIVLIQKYSRIWLRKSPPVPDHRRQSSDSQLHPQCRIAQVEGSIQHSLLDCPSIAEERKRCKNQPQKAGLGDQQSGKIAKSSGGSRCKSRQQAGSPATGAFPCPRQPAIFNFPGSGTAQTTAGKAAESSLHHCRTTQSIAKSYPRNTLTIAQTPSF